MGLCEVCDNFPCEGIVLIYSSLLDREYSTLHRQLNQQNKVGTISIDISKCPNYKCEGGEDE